MRCMTTITIPSSLVPTFEASEPTRVCDESGKVLGYYTPLREATDEEYEWAFREVTKEEIEYSRSSGPGRPAGEVIAELQRRFGK
jgi:hypothetical protein